MNRRRFLTLLAGSSAGVAGGGYLIGRRDGDSLPAGVASPLSPSTAGAGAVDGLAAADPAQRLLVVVEMPGGNDGLSMVVPYADSAYRRLRSATLIEPASVLQLDDRVGLHPSLPLLHARGVAVVQGVGTPNPDLSHFAMLDRWWTGDTAGEAAPGSGFLGRLCDAVGSADAPCVGLSIGTGPSRALVADTTTTLALPDLDAAQVLAPSDDDGMMTAFRDGFEAMMSDDGSDSDSALAAARRGGRDALAFASLARSAANYGSDGDDDSESMMEMYPGFELASRLQLAARVLAADVGIRVVHTAFGDFDTHDDHLDRYPGLMEEFDQSVDAFLNDIDRLGLGGRVLVMTISEFGRRAKDNGSAGLDHGAASAALLVGPVAAGLYGEYPSLTKLDDDDNLRATVRMDEYYATVAERWLGVPPSEVLAGSPAPLDIAVT